MNSQDTDLLLRWLDGALLPDERQAVDQRLAESPALRLDLEELQALQGLLRTSTQHTAEHALKPFFTDRLMRRLDGMRMKARWSPEEELFLGLMRLFRPIAIAGLSLILVFAAYNLMLADEYGIEQSTTEAVLALPPVSIATAYDADY